MSKGHEIVTSIYRDTAYVEMGQIVAGALPKKTARLVDAKRWGSNAGDADEFEVENISNGEFSLTIRYEKDAAGTKNTLEKSIEVGATEKLKFELPAPYFKAIEQDVIVQDREYVTETSKLIEVTYTFMPTGDPTESDIPAA